jgi:hypothetical protein
VVSVAVTDQLLEPVRRVVQTEARSQDVYVLDLVIKAFLRLFSSYATGNALGVKS